MRGTLNSGVTFLLRLLCAWGGSHASVGRVENDRHRRTNVISLINLKMALMYASKDMSIEYMTTMCEKHFIDL